MTRQQSRSPVTPRAATLACLFALAAGLAASSTPSRAAAGADTPIPMVRAGIAGVVISKPTGNPAPSRLVTLTSGGLILGMQFTSPEGAFEFDALYPGAYTLLVEGGEPTNVNIGSFHAFVTIAVP